MGIEHHLFFAILPRPAPTLAMAAVRQQQNDIISPVANNRLHGTMCITERFDHFPQALADRMQEIGDRVFAEPIDIKLDVISATEGSVALRPSRTLRGLGDFASQLQIPMLRAGIVRRDWNFNLHFTLGYRKGMTMRRRVDPIGWRCTEFALIHSLIGMTQHVELGRWPLVPRQYGLFD